MIFKARYKFGEITKRWGDANFKRDFDTILDDWLNQFSKHEKGILLELLKNFFYYTEVAIDKKVVELHQKFLHIHGNDIRKVIFAKIPKDYGVANSDMMFASYWFNNNLKGYSSNDVVREFLEKDVVPEVLVIVDDFVGSGDTVTEKLTQMLTISPELLNSKIYLLAIHASVIGIDNIDTFVKNIGLDFEFIYLDSTEPAFKEEYIFSKIESKIKQQEYTNICIDKKVGKNAILGYKDVQSLVSFEKTTPNDTLGLFWHSADNFVSLFRATRQERNTSIGTLKGIAKKNSYRDIVLFGIDDNQYNRFIVYCVVHGHNFSVDKACRDFGITPEILQKRLEYIADKGYVSLKDGKIIPSGSTQEKIIKKKLKGWEQAEKELREDNKIPLIKTNYLPRNFSQSFTGYKK